MEVQDEPKQKEEVPVRLTGHESHLEGVLTGQIRGILSTKVLILKGWNLLDTMTHAVTL